MNKFMKIAVEEAKKSVENGTGPFGAVIVKDGEILAVGNNQVTKNNDPTAHGEIVAIREACKKLGTFDLTGCEIYTSSEPCPMCFAAIHWARMKKIYYGCTIEDATKVGFDDTFIYDIMKGKEKDNIPSKQIDKEECLVPFKMWDEKEDKIEY